MYPMSPYSLHLACSLEQVSGHRIKCLPLLPPERSLCSDTDVNSRMSCDSGQCFPAKEDLTLFHSLSDLGSLAEIHKIARPLSLIRCEYSTNPELIMVLGLFGLVTTDRALLRRGRYCSRAKGLASVRQVRHSAKCRTWIGTVWRPFCGRPDRFNLEIYALGLE